MTVTTLLCAFLLLGSIFHSPWHGLGGHRDRGVQHVRHERPAGKAKVVVKARDDAHGAIKVRTHGGATHVRLGSGHHGLEVWTEEGGKTRVDLGDALKVETDEQGGAKVRLGDLVVDSD